jgi:hypothetical protein
MAWIVREEIEHLNLTAYRKAASRLVGTLEREVGELYRTVLPAFGDKDLPVKYFLWVKTIPCEACRTDVEGMSIRQPSFGSFRRSDGMHPCIPAFHLSAHNPRRIVRRSRRIRDR